MSFTYDISNISFSSSAELEARRNAVRMLLQDINEERVIFEDEEIAAYLGAESNIYTVAAELVDIARGGAKSEKIGSVVTEYWERNQQSWRDKAKVRVGSMSILRMGAAAASGVPRSSNGGTSSDTPATVIDVTQWDIGSDPPSGMKDGAFYLRTGAIDPGIYHRANGAWTLVFAGTVDTTNPDAVNALIQAWAESNDITQRVVVDQQPSAATLDKINFHEGELELTEVDHQGGTPPTARSADFTHRNYIGSESADPNVTPYSVGQWYFHDIKHRPRVLTDLDPITPGVQKGWIDATFGELVDPDPIYLGEYESAAAAGRNRRADRNALFFNTTADTLQIITSFTPGTASFLVHVFKKVITSRDLRTRDAAIDELTNNLDTLSSSVRGNLADIDNRIVHLGDLQAVMVSTAGSYNGTLDSQLGSPRPLIIHVSGDIAGTHSGNDYSWEEGDILYFAPTSASAEYLFRLPQPSTSGPGGGIDRDEALALIAAAAQEGNTDRWPKNKLPNDGAPDFIEEEVLTTTYYNTVLTAQASRDQPLIIWITADISGNRGSTGYDWDAQDVLYVLPNSETPIKLFNLGATPDDIRAADQRRADADMALAARIDNLDRNLSFDPPYFVRDTAASPPARTFIVHVPPSSQPAGTTHVGLVIQGVSASARVEVSPAGAYTFTIPSAGVANISRVQSSTAQVRVTFYDASSGGNALGHDDDVIRLLTAAPSELPTDGSDGQFLGHVRGVPAWVGNPRLTLTRYANEAALPANVPANTIAWYPEV